MVEWTEDGRPLRWVTETEPEFDAEEQESWRSLVEYEDATCPHCGLLRSICSNPDGLDGRGHYPQRTVCFVSAAAQRAQRKYLALHEDAAEDPAGYLPTDGVYIGASPYDLTPDDDFLQGAGGAVEELLARALAAKSTDELDHTDHSQDDARELGH